jgi:arylmalonate decarboxylase
MPAGADRLPHPQPQPLLPETVRRISSSLNISDYTSAGVQAAIRERYWACVDELVEQGAQSVTLAGFPIASQLGREHVLDLQQQTVARTGLVADSHAEATIAALRHLGATRVTIVSRWADALNEKLLAYLRHGGIEVLAVTSANQWGKQAFSMSIEEGVKLAFQLGRDAMRRAPQAEALLLAGGAWRSLAAIPILEEDFGIPVISNPIAPVWRLIQARIAPPVLGWGRLLAGGA